MRHRESRRLGKACCQSRITSKTLSKMQVRGR
uniref:Uncharacterized protein n=1 Tax=Rhizophora mucronata TaxID=61149 RepID=A0A2P2PD53_RHIMU